MIGRITLLVVLAVLFVALLILAGYVAGDLLRNIFEDWKRWRDRDEE